MGRADLRTSQAAGSETRSEQTADRRGRETHAEHKLRAGAARDRRGRETRREQVILGPLMRPVRRVSRPRRLFLFGAVFRLDLNSAPSVGLRTRYGPGNSHFGTHGGVRDSRRTNGHTAGSETLAERERVLRCDYNHIPGNTSHTMPDGQAKSCPSMPCPGTLAP